MNAAPTAIEKLERACAGLYTLRRMAVAIAASAVFYALLVNSSWHVTSDSGLYLGLARSLAEGQGYTFNFEPHALVPPGYPAMLAAARTTLGGGFLDLRIIHAALGWLTGVLVFMAMRRLYGNDMAFAVFLIYVPSYSLFNRSAYFLSDVPFAAAVWLALLATAWAMESARGGVMGEGDAGGERRGARTRWPAALAAGLALSLCPLLRVTGWGIVVAAIAVMALEWRRQGPAAWLRLAVAAAVAVAAPLAWAIWIRQAAAEGHLTYQAAVLAKGSGLLLSYLRTACGYVDETGSAMLGIGGLRWGVGLIAAGPAAVGAAALLRRRDLLLPVVVLVQYAGLCAGNPGERYLIAILPALYLFAAVGAVAIAQAAWRATAPRKLQAGLAAIALVVLAINLGHDCKSIWRARTAPAGGSEQADWQCWFEAAAWLKDHGIADPAARRVILTHQGNIVHFLTGMRFVPTQTLPKDGRMAVRPDYALIGDKPKEWDPAREAIAKAGGRFEPVPGCPKFGPLELVRIVWGEQAPSPP